ncbi:MAG: hypothetical protein ACRYGA_05850 [Janthinobacterium lividum]
MTVATVVCQALRQRIDAGEDCAQTKCKAGTAPSVEKRADAYTVRQLPHALSSISRNEFLSIRQIKRGRRAGRFTGGRAAGVVASVSAPLTLAVADGAHRSHEATAILAIVLRIKRVSFHSRVSPIEQ